MEVDRKFLEKAISKAIESSEKGLFPAGALVVKNNKIISLSVSATYPDYKHSESKAVDKAFDKLGESLRGCTLYCSLEPCLMCVTRAYWAGIRRIVFACRRNVVSQLYFEGINFTYNIIQSFNERLEIICLKELETDSLCVVRNWEKERIYHLKP
ncbi:MAG: deaminase [Candidatus Dojkabacteria bacterium]|nr:deaminase [Candidatus Dojkabacteria bacterium]